MPRRQKLTQQYVNETYTDKNLFKIYKKYYAIPAFKRLIDDVIARDMPTGVSFVEPVEAWVRSEQPTKFSIQCEVVYDKFRFRVDEFQEFPQSQGFSGTSGLGYQPFTRDLDKDQLRRCEHELALFSLTGSYEQQEMQDLPMGMIRFLDNQADNGTPDIIIPVFVRVGASEKITGHRRLDKWVVIEMKTAKGWKSAPTVAKAKAKYYNPLNERGIAADCSIYFSVIMMSRNSILMPPEMAVVESDCIAMQKHFQIGESILSKALEMDYEYFEDTEFAKTFNRFRKVIKELGNWEHISKTGTSKVHISVELLKHWKEQMPSIETADMSRFISDLTDKCESDMQKIQKMTTEDDIRAYMNRLAKRSQDTGSNCYLKPITPFPWIVVHQQPPLKSKDVFDNIPEMIAVQEDWSFDKINSAKIINNVIYKQPEFSDNFKRIPEHDEYLKAVGMQTTELAQEKLASMNKKKRNTNRVTADMSKDNVLYLSMHGGNKSMSEMEQVRQKKMKSSRPTDLSTPTIDITQFIEDGDHFKENTFSVEPNLKSFVKNLIDAGKSFKKHVGDTNHSDNIYANIEKTEIYRSAQIWSLIVEEINISLNQSVKNNTTTQEFVYKEILSGVWIIARPTSGEKKICLSIICDSRYYRSYELPFARMHKSGNLIWSDFFTMDRHKCSQYLGAHHQLVSYVVLNAHLFNVSPFVNLSPEDVATRYPRSRNLDESIRQSNADPNREKSKNCLEHITSMFISYLEDKPQTSAALQNIRYAYMETVKMGPIGPNPLKILKKLPDDPKSRLLVFFINNIIKHFKTMTDTPPVPVHNFNNLSAEEKRNQGKTKTKITLEEFDNLISVVNGQPIQYYSIALSFSYLGSLHNKDESDRVQGMFKIFTKIISEEIQMRNVNVEYLGWKVKHLNDYKDHEFDYRFALYCGKAMRRALINIHGENFDQILQKRVIEYLIGRKPEDYATLKASAVIPQTETFVPNCNDLSSEKVNNKPSEKFGKFSEKGIKKSRNLMHELESLGLGTEEIDLLLSNAMKENDPLKIRINNRRKALEGILELIDQDLMSHQAFSNFSELLNGLENRGYVMANLFKKLQHGGEREIFVLDILSRMVINFVECSNRVLGEMIPSEMLTKGEMKQVRTEQHYKRVYNRHQKNSSHSFMTNICSDDATTWAQRFVMPIFSSVLLPLYSDEMNGIFARIFNLVSSKRLELPYELLQQFSENPEMKSYSEEINELKRQWFGQQDEAGIIQNDLIAKKFGVFLTNTSNMMQGILHYTSSCVHACMLVALEEIFQTILLLEKSKGRIHPDVTLILTTKVSSDDSSMLMTLVGPHNGPEDDRIKRWQFLLTIFSLMKGAACQYISIKRSEEKSTYGVFSLIEEFNSIWFVNNGMVLPLIKQVHVSLRPVVIMKLDDRQLTMSGMRAQMVENGASHIVTSVIQECQARVHYMNLGSNSNRLFPRYKDLLLEFPCAAIGFFYFEPESYCGLFGYDFAEYIAIQHVENCSRAMNCLMTHEGLEISSDGRATVSATLLIGQGTRWRSFVKRVYGLFPMDWRKMADSDISMLYRRSRTSFEAMYRILRLANDPSSSASFDFQSGNKVHASSEYFLQAPCITSRKQMEKTYELRKCSMINFILRNFREEEEGLSDLSKKWMYPLSELYDQVVSIMIASETKDFHPLAARMPQRHLTITVPRAPIFTSLSLIEIVKRAWFPDSKMRARGTSFEHEQAWEAYQAAIPFLSKNIEDTLRNSRFRDHIALADFVSSFTPKDRTMKTLCSVKRGQPLLSTLIQLISLNSWYGIAKGDVSEEQEIELSSLNLKESVSTMNSTSLLISKADFLYDDKRENMYMEMFKNTHEGLPESTTLAADQLKNVRQKNDSHLMLIQRFCIGRKDVPDLIQTVKRGKQAIWARPQNYNEKGYYGSGILSIVIDKLVASVFVQDSSILLVKINSPHHLSNVKDEFWPFLKESGLSKFTPSTTAFVRQDVKVSGETWYLTETGVKTTVDVNIQYCNIESEKDLTAPKLNNDNIYFSITNAGNPCLRYKGNRDNSYVVLSAVPTSFNFKPSHLYHFKRYSPLINTDVPGFDLFMRNWFEYKKMTKEEIGVVVSTLNTSTKLPRGLNRDRYVEWLTRCFKMRATMLNLTSTNWEVKENEVPDMDFLNYQTQEMLEGYTQADIEMVKSLKSNEEFSQNILKNIFNSFETFEGMYEDFVSSDSNLWSVDATEQLLEAPKRRNDIMAHHIMWDQLIDIMQKEGTIINDLFLRYKVVSMSGSVTQIISVMTENFMKPEAPKEYFSFNIDDLDMLKPTTGSKQDTAQAAPVEDEYDELAAPDYSNDVEVEAPSNVKYENYSAVDFLSASVPISKSEETISNDQEPEQPSYVGKKKKRTNRASKKPNVFFDNDVT